MNILYRMKFVFLLLSCVLLFSSVNAEESVSPETQPDEFVTIQNSFADGDVFAVLPSTSKALSLESKEALSSISQDGRIFTFQNETVQLNQIEVGDVILSEGVPHAPTGYMRRVTAVTYEANQIIFITEQASLTDVFHEAQISIKQQITPQMIARLSLPEGMRLRNVDGELFDFEFTDVVLFDEDGDSGTVDDQVKANGSIVLDLTHKFDLDIQPFPPKLEELTFLVTASESVNLSIESDTVNITDITIEDELTTIPLPPIPVGIPGIAITPELEFSVGLSGNLQADLTSSVSQSFEFEGGVTYDGDQWDTFADYSNHFYYELPDLSESELELKAYLAASLNLYINGLVGPTITLKPYLLLTVMPGNVPWWTLTGGLDIDMGILVEVFDVTLVDQSFTLVDFRTQLAQTGSSLLYLPIIR